MHEGICEDMIERRLVRILLLNAGKRNDRRYMRFTRTETVNGKRTGRKVQERRVQSGTREACGVMAPVEMTSIQ